MSTQTEVAVDNQVPMVVMSDGTEKSLAATPAELEGEVQELMSAFEASDTNGIIMFATSKQKKSTEAAEVMLQGVRNKDLGPVGEGLNDITLAIRGMDLSGLKDNEEPGFFGRMMGKVSPLARWLASYESVEGQVEAIISDLDKKQIKLMEDVEQLDMLYDSQTDHFHGLEVSIEAAEKALEQINNEVLPRLQKEADKADDPMATSRYQDKVDMRDKIERRLHDLKLTRQVIIQNLPSIRMTQQSDTGLIEKIESVKANVIPMWKRQMATLVAAAQTKKVADSMNDIADLTDELLTGGAEAVRDANVEARKALERGIVSIEAVEYANQQVLGMIEDTQKIYEDAKVARADADQRMADAESKLKQAQLEMH